MSTELVIASSVNIPVPVVRPELPSLVERAGGAAFVWDEFFFAEHHNSHTQKAYMAAVRRFLAWVDDTWRGAGGDLAGDGKAVSRRAWRLGRQAESGLAALRGSLIGSSTGMSASSIRRHRCAE